MYTDKALELARDIAREQYTDDPDDPHWWEDEDEDEDEEPVNLQESYPGVVWYPGNESL